MLMQVANQPTKQSSSALLSTFDRHELFRPVRKHRCESVSMKQKFQFASFI